MQSPLVAVLIILGFCFVETAHSRLQAQLPPKEYLNVLPPTSQHKFIEVDPAWKKSICYLRLRPDAFVTVEKPSAKDIKQLFEETRYFTDSTDDPNAAVKIVTRYPNGKVSEEIDHLGRNQFTRSFFPDGNFATYTHWQNQKWIAGVAVNPRADSENHFSDGTGSLTVYDDLRAAAFTTTWYQKGDGYCEEHFRNGRLDKAQLFASDDSLISTKQKESLYLRSEHECWTRLTGSSPWVQTMGSSKNTDLPPMPMAWDGPAPRRDMFEHEREKVLAALKKVYVDSRRPSFVRRYSEILAASGHSWDELHIEFIRDDKPWPR